MLELIFKIVGRILLVAVLLIAADWVISSVSGIDGIHEPLMALVGGGYAIIEFLSNRDKFRISKDLQDTPVTGERTEEAYLHGRKRLHADLEKRFVSLQVDYSPTVSSPAHELKNIDEALEKFPKGFVLVGDPGAGKTTVLRYLERKAIDRFLNNRDDNRLPVWINLGLTNNPIDGQDLLQHWWADRLLPGQPDRYRKYSQLHLLLDGLNEMPLDTRKERAAALKALLDDPTSPIPAIITCRVDDYKHDEDVKQFDLPVVFVHPLNKDQILEFIDKYPDKNAVSGLWQLLNKDANADAMEMAHNPYKLSMLIAVYQQTGQLPSDAQELYSTYLERTYSAYREERGETFTPLIQMQWQRLEHKLKILAFRMIVDGNGLSLDVKRSVKRIGNKALKDGINMGVLRREGEQIMFHHQSLQGYFAVEKLSKILSSGYTLEKSVFSLNWKLSQLLLTMRKLALVAIQNIPRSIIDKTAHKALNIRIALIRQIGDLGENGAETTHKALNIRIALIRQIGDLGENGVVAVSALIRLLNDEDKDVRKSTVKALMKLEDERATEPLIKSLKDKDKDIREVISEALGQIGSGTATLPLIKMLKDGHWEVRKSSALALGQIGSDTATLPLIKMLKDGNLEVRKSSALALGQIGSKRATLPLIKMLKDTDYEICATAAYALGEICDGEAILALEGLRLHRKDTEVHSIASTALEKIRQRLAEEKATSENLE